eukprot:TRINITY_DN12136_c0_g2_i1.p1 TRINITY_DN12136_c0_g2~~TRINITY_DN12136_c0_g2_i1.p1  ORF type:complete len:271 (-),score=41.52 TRINITY_DN12136_c0_g2_i1:239-1051(-)
MALARFTFTGTLSLQIAGGSKPQVLDLGRANDNSQHRRVLSVAHSQAQRLLAYGRIRDSRSQEQVDGADCSNSELECIDHLDIGMPVLVARQGLGVYMGPERSEENSCKVRLLKNGSSDVSQDIVCLKSEVKPLPTRTPEQGDTVLPVRVGESLSRLLGVQGLVMYPAPFEADSTPAAPALALMLPTTAMGEPVPKFRKLTSDRSIASVTADLEKPCRQPNSIDSSSNNSNNGDINSKNKNNNNNNNNSDCSRSLELRRPWNCRHRTVLQ